MERASTFLHISLTTEKGGQPFAVYVREPPVIQVDASPKRRHEQSELKELRSRDSTGHHAGLTLGQFDRALKLYAYLRSPTF
ncbi:hypothetical protein EVAR_54506_1 [Eumeta japonica]|uniref:Uncharacterized protein n=1 Tax=Eumeta variegata TaxID=151549 RepID=A0A4C1YJG5_EUMVA|nr:hypothetical protein EVAR_54506_1 [Eumeta japonica]